MNNKSECCGCGACQQICPVQCVTMQPDEEGFLYPNMDESACVHCGKCELVCPIQHPQIPKESIEFYMGYASDRTIREVSSSGGVFSLLAQQVLKQKGVVFGAAFDENFRVHHIGIETEEELCKLRGSKYVQSCLGNTYVQARKCLTDGRWVLFSGTACQIAGLKKYLGKEYDRLLTVDVLCHGVPSPKIWELYLQAQEAKHHSSITSIQFRDKRSGWKLYSVTIQFENGQEYSVPFTKDPFMNMFLGNIDLRPSCHDCRFKGIPRVSDITIGDCWGVDSQLPEMDDDRGTSVILVHTKKGREVFAGIQGQMRIKKAETDQDVPGSAEFKKSVAMHPNRKKFWKAVQKGKQIEQLIRHTRKSFFQKAISLIQCFLMR